MPALAPTPEDREKQIAEMRKAEQLAMEELKKNPVGVPLAPTERDEVELLAMLAGQTARHMKDTKFSDNVSSNVAAPVMDARDVVKKFVGTTPGTLPPPGVAPPPSINLQSPSLAPRNPNDPQLELDLFRKMDMTDIYNILSLIKDRLDTIEAVNKDVVAFMKKVESS